MTPQKNEERINAFYIPKDIHMALKETAKANYHSIHQRLRMILADWYRKSKEEGTISDNGVST